MADLEAMKGRMTSELDAEFVDIFDDSDGCGQKLVITVVSGKFTGVSMIQQHRMVNKVIEVEREDIHAITLKTMTPEKYEKMQAAKTSGV